MSSAQWVVRVEVSRFPDLGAAGFDGGRERLALREIEPTLAFLSRRAPTQRQATTASYILASVISEWGGQRVSIGAAIAASAALGFLIHRQARNAIIGITRSSLLSPQLTVSLTAVEFIRLVALADQLGIPAAAVMRRAVAAYVAKFPRQCSQPDGGRDDQQHSHHDIERPSK